MPRWQPWATAGRCELGPRNYFRVIDHEKMAFFLLLLLLLILCVCVCARAGARVHTSPRVLHLLSAISYQVSTASSLALPLRFFESRPSAPFHSRLSFLRFPLASPTLPRASPPCALTSSAIIFTSERPRPRGRRSIQWDGNLITLSRPNEWPSLGFD